MTYPDRIPSASCYLSGVILDNRQLPLRKCGVPAYHGSYGRSCWSTDHVPGIGGPVYHRQCHLLRRPRHPVNAGWTDGARPWWRWHSQSESHHLIRSCSAATVPEVPKLHAASLRHWHEHSACARRRFCKDRVALVRQP